MIIYFDCDAQHWYPKREYKYVKFWNNNQLLPTRVDGYIRTSGGKEYMYKPLSSIPPLTMIISNNSKYLQHKFFNDPIKDVI